ncbi:MAG: IS3 family transposase [Isosphaeraceae bacterium]
MRAFSVVSSRLSGRCKKSLDAAGCSLDQKREVINILKDPYSMRLLCAALDVPRSVLYHQPRPTEDRLLGEALKELAGQWPTYGYRRLTVMLRRQGHRVNSKRVRRLMHELGLCGEAPVRRPRTTDSDHPFPRYPNLVEGLEVNRPDQVWVADITYVRLRKEYVYLAVIMDVFTRGIRGWHLGRSLEQELTITALRRAFDADFHGRENNQSLRAQGPSFLGDLPHRATLWLIVFSAQSGSVGFVSTFSIS